MKLRDLAVAVVLAATVAVSATGMATVVRRADANIEAAPTVVVVDRIVRTLPDWCAANGAEVDGQGRLRLFKWADTNGATQHGAVYRQGEAIEADDWDPDPTRECGGGLHACANLRAAEDWRDGRPMAVELLVDPADCRTPLPGDDYPTKIRFRRAQVVRVWGATDEEVRAQVSA